MREKVKNLRQSDGFTIIEVLIVLAIAGLIMLIVFLAVPQLQRNSRNTQRKNDAAAMLTAVGEYTSNNNGNAPTATNASEIEAIVPQEKRAYYKTDANISLQSGTAAAGTSNTTNVENMIIQVGRKCNAAGNASATGPGRSIVVLYAVETSGGGTTGQAQCIESGV